MTENKTHGRTKAGVELTDDVLDGLAEQAEAGLDLTNLRRRPGRPSHWTSFAKHCAGTSGPIDRTASR